MLSGYDGCDEVTDSYAELCGYAVLGTAVGSIGCLGRALGASAELCDPFIWFGFDLYVIGLVIFVASCLERRAAKSHSLKGE